jgi:hypothetical protein
MSRLHHRQKTGQDQRLNLPAAWFSSIPTQPFRSGEFAEATGLAAGHLHDGEFDYQEFIRSRRQADIPGRLRAIAKTVLQVDDLDAQSGLAEALMQAYKLGRKSLADKAK